jgi:tripartite-type tricarboxylate transporter receptor subunit TctC
MFRLLCTASVSGFLLTGVAFAQVYPSKPIRFINPFPPGGSIDVVARPVTEKLRVQWGQPVIMDFRPGGGTIIGASMVATAPPDGYTLYGAAGQHAIISSVYSKLPFDPVKDFTPVILLATGPYLQVVHPSVPAKSLRELIALARSQPGKLNYSSAGLGSGFHMAGELLNLMAGIKTTHVPYKGGAPAGTAVLSGEVDMTFGSPAVLLRYVEADRLRALAVTTPQRFKPLPNVPTMSEAGLPGFEVQSWYGVFAPAGTPQEIVSKLARQIDGILKSEDIRKLYDQAGLEPEGGTSQQFGQLFLKDVQKWAKVAKAAHVKVD